MTDQSDAPSADSPHLAELSGPAARRYADLVSISRDLSFVVACCEQLLALMEDEEAARSPSQAVFAQALWTAGLVAYCRCVATGKREGLDETIFDELPGEPRRVHTWMQQMRDKHVAHSVSPFEQYGVVAMVDREATDASGILGLMAVSFNIGRPGQDGVRGLAMLASRLGTLVEELENNARAAAREEAQDTPVTELLSKPYFTMTVPGPDDAGRAR